MKLFVLTLALLVSVAPIALTVRPYGHLTAYKDTITATVTLAPDPRNRMVSVELISEDYDTVSDRPLDGEKGPNRQLFTFRSVPPGDYKMVAWVTFLDQGKYKQVSKMFPGTLEFHD